MTLNGYELSEAERTFVLHWGEMGTRWGVNRTVAQVHALLYLAPRPLNAEEIATALSLARSTVSTSLRELQSWGIVRLVHVLGDRRDHFVTVEDVWEMFRMVIDERKRREVDPTLDILRESVRLSEAEAGGEASAHRSAKLRELLEFFEAMTAFYERTQNLPTPVLKRIAQSDESVNALVEVDSSED